jgi:AcrR family transcriptional regulator
LLTRKGKVINVYFVPKKKRAYHHGDLRRALVEASLEAIAELGPEQFTLREAARRAGVSPGAPYKHFADKDALITAVAAECSQRLGEAMDAATAAGGDDPLERFRLSGIAYVRFAVENPAHFRVMNLPQVASLKAYSKGVDEWMAEETARLADAQKRGLLAEIPLHAIFLAAQAMSYGLTRLIIDGHLGKVDGKKAAALAEQVTTVLGIGLIPRPSEPAPARAPKRRSSS